MPSSEAVRGLRSPASTLFIRPYRKLTYPPSSVLRRPRPRTTLDHPSLSQPRATSAPPRHPRQRGLFAIKCTPAQPR